MGKRAIKGVNKERQRGILGVLNESLAFSLRRVLSFRLYLICLEMFKQPPYLSGNSVVFYFTTNFKLIIIFIYFGLYGNRYY